MVFCGLEALLVRAEISLIAAHVLLQQLSLHGTGSVIGSWTRLWHVYALHYFYCWALRCPYNRLVRTMDLAECPLEISFDVVHAWSYFNIASIGKPGYFGAELRRHPLLGLLVLILWAIVPRSWQTRIQLLSIIHGCCHCYCCWLLGRNYRRQI